MSNEPQPGFDFQRYDPQSQPASAFRGGRAAISPTAATRTLQGLFDRLPPHSLEAEMSLLGSMILDHKVVGEVIGIVPNADYLFSPSHAAIFDCLVRNYDVHRSGDLVQLTEALRDRQLLDKVGGQDYLIQLAECVPSSVNAPHYARIVRDKAHLRRLIDAAGQILYDAYHSADAADAGAREILDKAEQMIFQIAEQSVGIDSEKLETLLEQALDMLDALHRSGRTITGIATGYYDLDEMTSGLQKGEMIIVAARPSMGKTAFALNLAEQVAFGGSPHDEKGPHTPVGFFSMEMSKQSVVQRLLSAHSGVDSHKMRRNILSHEDFRQLATSCGRLAEAPIFIDDTPGLTVLMLRAKARRMVAQHGVRCIFVDYLQLMSAPSAAKESRQAEVSTISRGMKALARELNIPIVCLAQLNRQAELREGNRPRMADLRESGSLEQDADVIMLLHREEYYHLQSQTWAEENPDKVGIAEVIIAKQRNGPTGTVELRWNASTTRFQNLSRSHAPEITTRPAEPTSRPPTPSPTPTPPSSFAPGSKSGPVENYRDGGGPDRDPPESSEENIDDIPI